MRGDLFPYVGCCLGYVELCACGHEERYLRAVSNGRADLTTDEQREWCLAEIDKTEGYDRADFLHCDSAALARGVLGAWTDFCRDKGLLP